MSTHGAHLDSCHDSGEADGVHTRLLLLRGHDVSILLPSVTSEDDSRMNEERTNSIKVTDRRHFYADGTRRQEVQEEPEQTAAQTGTSDSSASVQPPTSEQENPAFLDLLANLISNAAGYLGLAPHPVTGQTTLDLDGAKHMIDVLEALQEKTRGNLTASEREFLDNSLAQLQLAYVRASSAKHSA